MASLFFNHRLLEGVWQLEVFCFFKEGMAMFYSELRRCVTQPYLFCWCCLYVWQSFHIIRCLWGLIGSLMGEYSCYQLFQNDESLVVVTHCILQAGLGVQMVELRMIWNELSRGLLRCLYLIIKWIVRMWIRKIFMSNFFLWILRKNNLQDFEATAHRYIWREWHLCS